MITERSNPLRCRGHSGLDKVPELVSALMDMPEKLIPDDVSPSVDTAHILGHDFPPTLSPDAAARFGERLRVAYGLDSGIGNFQTVSRAPICLGGVSINYGTHF